MSERQKASKFRSEMRQRYGKDVHVQIIQDARNTQKKPYDTYVVKKGKFYALEFKEVTGLSISAGCVTNNQILSLLEVVANGGTALVWVFFKRKEFQKISYCFTIQEWLMLFGYKQTDGSDTPSPMWMSTINSVKVEGLKEIHNYNKLLMERKSINGATMWTFGKMFRLRKFHELA